MEPEMLEIVLQEILNEQKETNLINAQFATYIKSMSEKMKDLDNKVGRVSNLTESDNSKLLSQMKAYIENIKLEFEARQAGVTNKKIYQFFPSLNIREYYQVYGNILKWFTWFGVACLVIRLVRDLLEKQGFL